jgi:predicted lipoprotein with Yx(FWY)xxD motif
VEDYSSAAFPFGDPTWQATSLASAIAGCQEEMVSTSPGVMTTWSRGLWNKRVSTVVYRRLDNRHDRRNDMKHLPRRMLASLSIAVSAALLAALPTVASAQASTKDGKLVATNGMTLYVFDKDSDGKSACTGQCATNWPPFTADASSGAKGDWTVITRDDGKKQWAYKGKPLYFFVKDQKPGDANGDGVNKVWHAAKP